MVEIPEGVRANRRRAGSGTVVAVAVALVLTLVGGVLVLGGLTGGTVAQAAPTGTSPASRAPHGRVAAGVAHPSVRSATTTTLPAKVAAAVAPVAPPTTTTTAPAAAAVAAATPAAAPTTSPTSTTADVAALVAQAEASGIDPGPTWSWSFGDTSSCGAIPGDNLGTGCTSGAAGAVTTVFAGSPGLLLVAHELANAETENYAVPDLVSLVSRSAGGTSWSAIDAVASCLVVHFLHVPAGAAGTCRKWTTRHDR